MTHRLQQRLCQNQELLLLLLQGKLRRILTMTGARRSHEEVI